MNDTLKERIFNELDSYGFDEANHGGEYIIKDDSDAVISVADCNKICRSEHPMDAFYDWQYEWLIDCEGFAECTDKSCVIDEIMDSLKEKNLISEDDEDDALEILKDAISVSLQEPDFLEQEVCVDITIDTGDANYDYVLNTIEPAYDGQNLETEIAKESSLRWLAETQGYTEKEMRETLLEYEENDAPEHGFMPSVFRELLNTSSHINELTILTKMSLGDLINLNEKIIQSSYENGSYQYNAEEKTDSGTIHVSKDAIIGLFDSWNGGGSLFEIELDHDIELPIKYIASAEADTHVEEVYGADEDWWQKVVTGISE